MKMKYYKIIPIAYFVFISAGTQADTDEDQFSAMDDGDIFISDTPKRNFSTMSDPSSSARDEGPDPKLLYREALLSAIKLFDTQNIQINYTRIHFANVWGVEDEGVKRAMAKLNSMEALLKQNLKILQNRLEGELDRRERSIMPVNWTTLDILGKGWKEIETLIDGKCAEKNLTKTQADELLFLREWLKYSDQELALTYNTMKERMVEILAAEPARPFSNLQNVSSEIYAPI